MGRLWINEQTMQTDIELTLFNLLALLNISNIAVN